MTSTFQRFRSNASTPSVYSPINHHVCGPIFCICVKFWGNWLEIICAHLCTTIQRLCMKAPTPSVRDPINHYVLATPTSSHIWYFWKRLGIVCAHDRVRLLTFVPKCFTPTVHHFITPHVHSPPPLLWCLWKILVSCLCLSLIHISEPTRPY